MEFALCRRRLPLDSRLLDFVAFDKTTQIVHIVISAKAGIPKTTSAFIIQSEFSGLDE
jgi:hypothetical protein